MSKTSKMPRGRRAMAVPAPLSPCQRRVMIPGLLDPTGNPVIGITTGDARRPGVRAVIGFGALVAAGAARGGA